MCPSTCLLYVTNSSISTTCLAACSGHLPVYLYKKKCPHTPPLSFLLFTYAFYCLTSLSWENDSILLGRKSLPYRWYRGRPPEYCPRISAMRRLDRLGIFSWEWRNMKYWEVLIESLVRNFPFAELPITSRHKFKITGGRLQGSLKQSYFYPESGWNQGPIPVGW